MKDNNIEVRWFMEGIFSKIKNYQLFLLHLEHLRLSGHDTFKTDTSALETFNGYLMAYEELGCIDHKTRVDFMRLFTIMIEKDREEYLQHLKDLEGLDDPDDPDDPDRLFDSEEW